MTERRHSGSCSCGAITFEVDIDLAKGVTRCNCTFCTKLGTTGSIVKPAALVRVTVEPRDVEIGYFDGRHDNWMAGTRKEPWPALSPK